MVKAGSSAGCSALQCEKSCCLESRLQTFNRRQQRISIIKLKVSAHNDVLRCQFTFTRQRMHLVMWWQENGGFFQQLAMLVDQVFSASSNLLRHTSMAKRLATCRWLIKYIANSVDKASTLEGVWEIGGGMPMIRQIHAIEIWRITYNHMVLFCFSTSAVYARITAPLSQIHISVID